MTYACASRKGREFIILLLERGANPLLRAEGEVKSVSPLELSLFREDHFDILQLLFSYVPEEEKQGALERLLDLMPKLSMEECQAEAISCLIHMGADPNYKVDVGATFDRPPGEMLLSLLSWACVLEDQQLVTLLLENGANPRLRQKGEKSPLEAAIIYKNRLDYLELMFSFVPDNRKQATLQGLLCKTLSFQIEHKVEALNRLIQMGADVNQPDKWGRFPLFFAFEAPGDDEAEELVRFLLENGADPLTPLGSEGLIDKFAYQQAVGHLHSLHFLLRNIEVELRIELLERLLHRTARSTPKREILKNFGLIV